MKKIIACVFLMFLWTNSASAKDYVQFCAFQEASKTFSGKILSVSGMNLLSKSIIEREIQKSLKKETNSKFKVNIDNFYGVNILDGQFKSLNAESSEFSYNGLFMSNLFVETLCPYNHVALDNKEIFFKENMVLKYRTDITQNDLNKMLNSSEYKKIIDKMNSDVVISSLIKIQNSNIEIKDNKLSFKYEVLPLPKYDILPFSFVALKPLNIAFRTNLKATDGKVELCDFEMNSKKFINENFLSIINRLNPLSYGITPDKNTQGRLEVENVKIADSKIAIDGVVIILKNQDK